VESEQTSSGGEGLEPLNITCTSSDCENGTHCFRPGDRKSRRNNAHLVSDPDGRCRTCGAQLVDWERVRKRDLTDVEYTFQALKHETIRHHFWHIPFDEKAIKYARRDGLKQLRADAHNRVRKAIGLDVSRIFRDGIQTPKTGNVLFYAQHATATCCRKCVEYWHGIPRDRVLSEEEISYLAALVFRYVEDRLPFVTLDGEAVPGVRRRRAAMVAHSSPQSEGAQAARAL
jgi:hypothetical protein